jgi:hypothetical protein
MKNLSSPSSRMGSVDPDGYGSGWWPALRADVRDRRRGERAKANARRGFLLPPRGEGKVVWFKAGGSRESVLLACELLGALRERRIDVRLALTFEHDYADVIEPRVRGLRKIGLGYGPGDRPAAVGNVMRRLNPFGLVLVDTQPYPNLLSGAARAGTHLVAFNTPAADTGVEAAYPCDASQAKAWRDGGTAQYVAEPADPLALFVEAQADTTLRSLAAAGRGELKLWWWHGPVAAAGDFVRRWRSSPLATGGVLFLSSDEGDASAVADLNISRWNREPLPEGSVVAVDDLRWTAAVASAIDAGHLQAAARRTAWQALAGNSAISFGANRTVAAADDENATLTDADAVLREWQTLHSEPVEARRRGDAGRRRFWEERRRAQKVMDEFLQRAFDW